MKFPTIQILISLAISNNWPLRQLDIDNAFLNGDLKQVVFMTQPPFFTDIQHPSKVYCLHKSIHKLKKSPGAWYKKLHNLWWRSISSGKSTSSIVLTYTRWAVISANLKLLIQEIMLYKVDPLFVGPQTLFIRIRRGSYRGNIVTLCHVAISHKGWRLLTRTHRLPREVDISTSVDWKLSSYLGRVDGSLTNRNHQLLQAIENITILPYVKHFRWTSRVSMTSECLEP